MLVNLWKFSNLFSICILGIMACAKTTTGDSVSPNKGRGGISNVIPNTGDPNCVEVGCEDNSVVDSNSTPNAGNTPSNANAPVEISPTPQGSQAPAELPTPCVPGNGVTKLTLLTKEYKQGPGAKIDYKLSVIDCDGVQVKIKPTNLNFDFKAKVKSGWESVKVGLNGVKIPYGIVTQDATEKFSGKLKDVPFSDLFGNKGLLYQHFTSSETIEFTTSPTELLVTLDVSELIYTAPLNESKDAAKLPKMVIPTYMSLGDAIPATADVITNRP